MATMRNRKRQKAKCVIEREDRELREVESPDIEQEQSPWIGGLIVFAVMSSVYTITLFPGVPGGDAGELIAEACHLGTAHPPGYPLYTLITHIAIRFFPWNNPAWRANFCNMIFGALSCAFLSMAVEQWNNNRNRIAGPVIGCLFGFSPLIWLYHVSAEVFALNNAFASILLWLTIRVVQSEHPNFIDLMLGSFISGLSLTNQHTIVFYAAPFVLYILFKLYMIKLISIRLFVSLFGAFVMGLTPYGYLVWSSLYNQQPGSWGDQSTISGLLRHITREEYGTLKLSPMKSQTEGFIERTWAFMLDINEQGLGLLIPLLFTLGAYVSISQTSLLWPKSHKNVDPAKNNRRINVSRLIFSALIIYTSVFHALANLPLSSAMPRMVHQRFWMQAHLIIFWFSGIGIVALSSWIETRYKNLSKFVSFLLVIAVIAQFSIHYENMDHSESGWVVQNYGRSVFENLPQKSLLFSSTDLNWNSIRYLQRCENFRPDLVHANFHVMAYPWFSKQLDLHSPMLVPNLPRSQFSTDTSDPRTSKMIAFYLDINLNRFPAIFIDLHAINPADIGSHGIFQKKFQLLPYGPLWKVYRINNAPSLIQWTQDGVKLFEKFDQKLTVYHPSKYAPGTWEHAVGCIRGDAAYQLGVHLLSSALEPRSQEIIAPNQFLFAVKTSIRLIRNVLYGYEQFKHFSSSHKDVVKNLALAYTRLFLAYKSDPEFFKEVQLPYPNDSKQSNSTMTRTIPFMSDKVIIQETADLWLSTLRTLGPQTVSSIKRYLLEFPNDPDAPQFKNVLEVLEKAGLGKMS